MEKIKIDNVIIGDNGYDSIVSGSTQICIPSGTDVDKFIGKTVNITFGKEVKFVECKNMK